MNFSFLLKEPDYSVFASSAIEAETILPLSPAMSCAASRKALELAIKWVYAADSTMSMPYKDSLSSLIFEDSFKDAVDPATWSKLKIITKLGNLAVHTNKQVTRPEAILSLSTLFEFIEWLDYCYGKDYTERHFDERLLEEGKASDRKAIKDSDPMVKIDGKKCKEELKPIEKKSEIFTSKKDENKNSRSFTPEELTEYDVRKRYIDVDLKLLGWDLGKDAKEEVPVRSMPTKSGIGRIDYVLYGKDGLPLALIEAKRTIKDPRDGKIQAKLYADCLEKETGRRPIIFTTNGFEYEIWDDVNYPSRAVFGIFSKQDLEKLISRRSQKKKLLEIPVSDKITDRYYQKEAIAAVCENIEKGSRSSLLVMATGTGKTRTSASLVDVLSRGNHVTNVLFLADRKALVKQARNNFNEYLPDLSLCNLVENKKEKNARIVFSTYPTILNAIDTEKNNKGAKFFTPAHFDLVIIDEAHRSIFKKYKVIFNYFDSLVLGLTATPKTDVDKNTYEFFNMENGVPTYAYDYETAVYKDKVLVPYYSIESKSKFLNDGITYDDLSEEDKEKYEEDFQDEDGEFPDKIPADKIDKFIFNEDTVDYVIEQLILIFSG